MACGRKEATQQQKDASKARFGGCYVHSPHACPCGETLECDHLFGDPNTCDDSEPALFAPLCRTLNRVEGGIKGARRRFPSTQGAAHLPEELHPGTLLNTAESHFKCHRTMCAYACAAKAFFVATTFYPNHVDDVRKAALQVFQYARHSNLPDCICVATERCVRRLPESLPEAYKTELCREYVKLFNECNQPELAFKAADRVRSLVAKWLKTENLEWLTRNEWRRDRLLQIGNKSPLRGEELAELEERIRQAKSDVPNIQLNLEEVYTWDCFARGRQSTALKYLNERYESLHSAKGTPPYTPDNVPQLMWDYACARAASKSKRGARMSAVTAIVKRVIEAHWNRGWRPFQPFDGFAESAYEPLADVLNTMNLRPADFLRGRSLPGPVVCLAKTAFGELCNR